VATVEPRTAVRAEARYVRAAPRKVQLVVDRIRGRSVPEARAILAFMTRDAARDVRRVLDSAVANAEANHGLVGDELVVTTAYVGAGPVLKRWRARARGRVGRIRKRTCHITIALAPPGGAAIPEPLPRVAPTPAPAEPEEAPEAEAEAPEDETEAPEAEAAEAEAPAEDAPDAEEAPKPKRAPRKRVQAAEGEEKPKRTRAAKPKAEAEEQAEKPKKAPAKPKARKKATETDETDEGSS
jgi:large subunit ribosomal protein L22